ncbi:hypothetical protein K492DRAFT_193476 [Lichtheimia hyalospora FSU 10163]|nr:hypothetical protein K492DRAFT_193476 [Lichtheimia hyalospora FSU 10163]
MPSFDFAGVSNNTNTQQAKLSFDGHVAKINFDLLIHAQNPNVLGIDLTHINATASSIKLGGGYLDHQFVSPHANENFSFPFAIEYDPFGPSHETILKLLLEKCGLAGGQPQDLNIDYTIHVTAKVLFVTVHPTIQSSTTFKCPLEDGSALLGSRMPGLDTLGGLLHG